MQLPLYPLIRFYFQSMGTRNLNHIAYPEWAHCNLYFTAEVTYTVSESDFRLGRLEIDLK